MKAGNVVPGIKRLSADFGNGSKVTFDAMTKACPLLKAEPNTLERCRLSVSHLEFP